MASKKIQLYTDRDKTIEASPETMAKNVTLSDGLDVESVLRHDLTAPTVTHEETSFKIGIGDIDVSSSVVDGEPSKVVIKGKTYQNILPEPSLRNSMTNGKSMQKLNEGYENVNVVDGVARSAILKGNTLVNLAQKFGYAYAWEGSSIDENNIVTADASIGSGYRWCHNPLNIGLIKPSSQYTVVIEVFENTLDYPMEVCYGGLNGTTYGVCFNSLQGIPLSFVGTLKLLATSKENVGIQDQKLTTHVRFTNDNTSGIIKYRVSILEGDYTNVDIPYFEGMQSVRMPVLKTTGKNLFNTNKQITSNATYEVIGDELILSCSSAGWYNLKLEFFNLTPNKPYTLSYDYEILEGSPNNQIIVVDSSNTTISNNIAPSDGKISMIFYCGNSTKFGKIRYYNIQLEETSAPTPYEPYKSNILSTLEPVELRGIGDVQDTLDLNTGKLTNYYGERIVTEEDSFSTTLLDGKCTCIVGNLTDKISSYSSDNFLADKVSHGAPANTDFGIYQNLGNFVIYETGDDLEAFKAKVIGTKIYYRLAEPVHKTVDLSSYGNWNKVTLNGSENGWGVSFTDWKNKVFCLTNAYLPNVVIPTDVSVAYVMCDKLKGRSIDWLCGELGRTGVALHHWFEDYLQIAIDGINTIDELKQYLSENPITVWYPTKTQQENSITEMLSFNDGHIQLSSEEGSLLPSLDYEVPTSNSYHMDLMKTNTRYTMKCTHSGGTFTIDNAQYSMGSNTSFISPSSLTNKLLVINSTMNNGMIIEGNLTSTTLPYFTGIKSAFEGESKIEVLSTGKNLFNMNGEYILPNKKATVVQNLNEITISSVENGTYVNAYFVLDKDFFKGKTVIGSCLYEYDMKGIGTVQINYQDVNGKRYYHSLKPQHRESFTFPNEIIGNILLCIYANNTGTPQSNTVRVKNIQLELGKKATSYEPYKSNVSKIPLLSPLRSLPNGACDELIIDRMKKKATLIQRVGKAMFDGSDNEIWGFMDSPSDTTSYLYQCYVRDAKANSNDASEHLLCKNILVRTANSNWNNKYESGIALNENKNIQLRCTKDESSFRSWLSKNPTTVYYQLETPVVTEVDLEGFPYIYKDGHIFLNSEIAPVVEIAYNVNQTQQIQANNETLQRHELDIDNLDSLIAGFIHADYQLRLFQFDYDMATMSARKGK